MSVAAEGDSLSHWNATCTSDLLLGLFDTGRLNPADSPYSVGPLCPFTLYYGVAMEAPMRYCTLRRYLGLYLSGWYSAPTVTPVRFM